MTHSRTRRLVGVVAVAAAAATVAATAGGTASAAKNGPTMDIQLLSFNDFHGNLEPPTGSGGRLVVDHKIDPATGKPVDVTQDAGGVEYLANTLNTLRQGNPNSLTVAAGDLVGASPLLSAAFYDEPSIEALNKLGLDASSVGNHEFDGGYKELQRKANGGCIDDGDGANNKNSCPAGTFTGADFDYLAANVTYEGTDKTVLPPYSIKKIKGAKIGFIGMTLENTPNIVTASGVAGLDFSDEVETANKLVPVLKKQGVNAIVVLVHEGGFPASKQNWTAPDGTTYSVNANYDYTCQKGGVLSGPIVDIAGGLDPAIDMVVSGHTHAPYVCDVKDPAGQSRLVTSASSFGRLVTETNFKFDRRTKDIVRSSVTAKNVVVARDTKDAAQTALIAKYRELLGPIASRVLGTVTTDVTRATNAGGESPLGDLIADAQLADPSVVTNGQTPVIAFMNPGGIRADVQAGEVTFEDAFTVQPFNNFLVSLDLTGAQIKTLLTQQWSGVNAGAPKILQVSDGFAYTYSGTTLGSVTLNGQPIVDGQTYRVVTNNFLADGGDGFPVFTQATNKYFGGLDIDAFANYLEANSPYTPGPLDRITKN
jgi:5'-nucleotidase